MNNISDRTPGHIGSPRSRLAARIVAVFAGVLAFAPQIAAAATCTPFGDKERTYISNPVPTCPNGGQLVTESDGSTWADADGHARYACLWKPTNMNGPLPLLVFIHASLSNADSVASYTNILDGINTANLSGDPAHPGFILLAPQGRSIYHLYPYPDNKGLGWDNWYRQFDPAGVTVSGTLYRENVDAEAIDHYIQKEVATGEVDTKRIYMTGWSNGAAMAYAYALNRPNIAAFSPYSAPDPWASGIDPCEQTPVTATPASNAEIQIAAAQVPSYEIHNYCDIGGSCPNMLRMESRLQALGSPATNTIIDSDQTAHSPQGVCDSSCGTNPDGSPYSASGTVNHIRWPTDWTSAMEDFLLNHPLP